MGVSQALETALKDRAMKMSDVKLPYSRSMKSMIKSGQREIAPDLAPTLAKELDHVAMYSALAAQATGGVTVEFLDGDSIDRHRSAVRELCLEELQAVTEAIEKEHTTKPPSVETESENRRRWNHLLDAMDGLDTIWTYVGVQCEEYGFSLKDLWEAHHQRLKARHMVTE